ncbi:MAG: glutathione S-transferase [Myxococcota bacterium]|nr:glutathione S-transferase [Myxococcota bacterium]
MELKLYYFNFPFWRAESARLALHLGDIDFEDIRVDGATFRAMRERGELPFGQLPVLDMNGERIAQTGAILRICGTLSGFYPAGDLTQCARIDELIDAATDVTHLIGRSMRIKDRAERLACRADLAAHGLPKWLGYLTAWMDRHGGVDYLVGDRLTVGDLVVWRLMAWLTGGILDGIPRDIGDGFPALMAHYERVNQRPKVRAWMKRYDAA